jgi:hypothetical protein
MVRFEHKLTLNNDVDEIFPYITNPENNPIWDLNPFEEGMSAEDSIEVGTGGRSTCKFLGNSYEMNFTVSDYDPPNCVSHLITAGPLVVEMTNDLESVENGSRLTVSMRIRLKGIRKMTEPFIAKKIRRQTISNLEVLQLFFRLKALSYS